MSQGLVIDIMTYNSYSLQYYSFRKGKIGFARTVPVFLDNANSHQALQYNNITVSKNDFLRYSWQLTVSENEFFALQSLQLIVLQKKYLLLVDYQYYTL